MKEQEQFDALFKSKLVNKKMTVNQKVLLIPSGSIAAKGIGAFLKSNIFSKTVALIKTKVVITLPVKLIAISATILSSGVLVYNALEKNDDLPTELPATIIVPDKIINTIELEESVDIEDCNLDIIDEVLTNKEADNRVSEAIIPIKEEVEELTEQIISSKEDTISFDSNEEVVLPTSYSEPELIAPLIQDTVVSEEVENKKKKRNKKEVKRLR